MWMKQKHEKPSKEKPVDEKPNIDRETKSNLKQKHEEPVDEEKPNIDRETGSAASNDKGMNSLGDKPSQDSNCKPPKLVGVCKVEQNEKCTSSSKLDGQAYCHDAKCACREGRITKKIVDDYLDVESNRPHHYKTQVTMECWVMDENCGSAGFSSVLVQKKTMAKKQPNASKPGHSPPASPIEKKAAIATKKSWLCKYIR